MRNCVYTLYWLSGTRQLVRGKGIADAMTRAGYGAGALRALDFYANGDNNEYEWRDGKWRMRATEAK